MTLKLFDRKRHSLNLRRQEEITTISGFGPTIFLGTSFGFLLIFNTSKHSTGWEEEARLRLSEESNTKTPIAQICSASALELVIVLHGEDLFGLLLGAELKIERLLDKARRVALNSNPTTDDPFSVQLAIAHSRKPLIIVGHISAEDDANRIRKEHKLNIAGGKVVELTFNGHCLCYATEKGAYFVHNLQEKSSGAAIQLFEATNAHVPHVMCPIGMEEFSLAGIHGLVMFVNGQGVSMRPPISLPGNYPTVGFTFKEPFYYMLDSSGMLFVFSTMDGQLKQCLDFPTLDEENGPRQPNSPHQYQLANVDGQMFVLPPASSDCCCLFELVSVEIFAQIDDHIQLGHLDTAIAMMEDNLAQICTSSDEEDEKIMQLRHFQLKIALLFLKRGEFIKATELMLKCEADPRLLLSIVVKQHAAIGLGMEDGEEGSGCFVHPKLPIDDSDDETFIEIPLSIVEEYLQRICAQQSSSPHIELVESALARISTVLDKPIPGEYLNPSSAWNNPRFRQWLASERGHLNRAAMMAEDAGCFDEAFTYWTRIATENGGGNQDTLADCLQTLPKVKSAAVMASALPWLVPIDPKLCMDVIENLDTMSTGEHIPVELVVQQFAAGHPELLFAYLDKRIYHLDSPILHDKMFDLYWFLLQSEQQENVSKRRQKFHQFLLCSKHYERTRAQQNYFESEMYRVERLLARANDDCAAIDCLRELTSNIEQQSDTERQQTLTIAEMLCTHYQSAEMLKALLTVHLRLSSTDPSLRLQIPRLLSLFHNEMDAAELLQNIPKDLDCSSLVHNFLSRHFSNRLNNQEWQKMHKKLAELEGHKLERELVERRTRTSFRMDENSECAICERRLVAGEEFVRNPHSGQLDHLRCHQAKRERI